MSIDTCKSCQQQTDTDFDLEFYENGCKCEVCVMEAEAEVADQFLFGDGLEYAMAVLDPEQLGFTVSAAERDAARVKLGIEPCETVKE